MKHNRLLALGGAYVDINCLKVPFDDAGLAVEEEVVGPEYFAEPGGSALNFARLCASLGLRPTFIGKTGHDAMASLLDQLLQNTGVVPALIADEKVQTNIGINIVNPEGLAVPLVVGTANKSLTTEDVLEKALPLLPEIDYLYLGTLFKLKRLLPAFDKLVQNAHAHHVKVVIDHNRVTNVVTKEDMAHVRRLVQAGNYYFPSKDELCKVWDVTDIEAGLRKIAAHAPQLTTAVKDADNGAYTLEEGRLVHVSAFKVTPLNTVGAGDSFNAGVIVGITEGLNIKEAIRLGCATAALKISKPQTPTRAEVEALATKR